MRLLVVCAVAAEARAVVAALPEPSQVRLGPYAATVGSTAGGELAVLAGGVGPAAAAAATATALAVGGGWDAVVAVGIAGGFTGQAAAGDVVVATEAVAADLGADFPDGFRPLGGLGYPGDRFPAPHADVLAARLRVAALPVTAGPVLTVSTVTGSPARAAELAARHGAVAEAMEGTGVATAAAAYGVPFGEVRTVSNLVGDSDRTRWEIPRALARLTAVARALREEPLCTR